MINFRNNFVGISNRIMFSIKIFFILIVLFYLIFHLISGKNGLKSYFVIQKDLATQVALAKKLKDEREILEKNVKLLGNKSLDLDILEERCRKILNYAYPDDLVIREKTLDPP
ncbi:MAG: septum formation initiator family protein [Holosporales bacterium]|jgi:cell division protein FtsB|nr:septum formation initiator family protein [Holosporales bacterium]